jgi:hypothetical protein
MRGIASITEEDVTDRGKYYLHRKLLFTRTWREELRRRIRGVVSITEEDVTDVIIPDAGEGSRYSCQTLSLV